MRIALFLFIAGVLLIPALSQSEIFYLKDGSTLQGELVRFANDTLYVKTSFGARVPIHKSVLLRVDFAEDLPTGIAPVVGGATKAPAEAPMESAEAGTLQVHFDKFSVSSEVIVERNRDRTKVLRANAIESHLLVNGVKVHSEIDSVMDKEIRKGPETLYRNRMEPRGFMVVLQPGMHHCELTIGNTRYGEYEKNFPEGVLDKSLIMDDLKIKPGHTTQVRVGLRKKFKGLGASYLYVIDER